MSTEGDQGSDALEPEVQTPEVQGTEGTEQADQGTVDTEQGIVVGNQRFESVDALVKAQLELQKAFTQKTQEYSSKIKAYEGFDRFLAQIKQEPGAWERFVHYVRNGASVAQAASAVKKDEKKEESDPRFDQLSRSQEETKAAIEFLDFRSTHPEMDKDSLNKVLQLAIDKDAEGENWSLEMCRRWLLAEGDIQAKLVEHGQTQVKESLAKGKSAQVLGAAPSAPQSIAKNKATAKSAKPWTKMSAREQLEVVERKLRESGAVFEDEV